MFSPEDREKLIEELNKQIDNHEFYQFDSIHTINTLENSISTNATVSPEFKGVGLFRPLVTSEYNPFKSNIYHYEKMPEPKVHGIAFSGTDMSYIPSYQEKSSVLIKEVAKNTYNITDILQNTSESDVINFNTIPKNLALAKKNTVKDILFKQIDLTGALKKVFHLYQ